MKLLPYKLLLILCLSPGVQAVLMAQFSQRLLSNEKPWTKTPAVKGNEFRFLITGDITGGEEPGVFAAAIQRINDLSPDFVLSVGDLIDGYTYDSARIEKQWDLFTSTLSKLESPFFFTAGNHDISNPLMKAIWAKRFGTDFYSFTVGKALFLILNVVGNGDQNFSDAQFDYFRQQVEKHPVQSPIFIIQHIPAWENLDNGNINKLLAMMQNKNAYWFCGHEHRYLHKTIHNQPHFMLAGLATGGPGMLGPEFGEFHNLMMVTVREQDIKIANFDLDALLPLSLVDETTDKFTRNLRSADWASLTPIFSINDSFNLLKTNLVLSNPGVCPIEIDGAFNPGSGLDINPSTIHCSLQPDEQSDIPVTIFTTKKVSIHDIPEIKLNLSANSLQPCKNLQISITKKLVLDYLERCTSKTNLLVPNYSRQLPAQVDEEWDWKDFDDAGFELYTQYNDKDLLIEILVTDDILNTALNKKQADKLCVWFAADTSLNTTEYLKFGFVAGNSKATFGSGDKKYKNIITKCEITGNKLHALVSIPLKALSGNYFRLNLSYLDVDDPWNMDHATLWWKPRWESSNNYHGAGLFMLE